VLAVLNRSTTSWRSSMRSCRPTWAAAAAEAEARGSIHSPSQIQAFQVRDPTIQCWNLAIQSLLRSELCPQLLGCLRSATEIHGPVERGLGRPGWSAGRRTRCASSTTGARTAVIGMATMVDADLALYVLSSSTLVCWPLASCCFDYSSFRSESALELE